MVKKICSLCVVQIRSLANCRSSQVLSLKALGLGKIGKRSVLKDNDCVRGLIKKVSHLVKIEALNE